MIRSKKYITILIVITGGLLWYIYSYPYKALTLSSNSAPNAENSAEQPAVSESGKLTRIFSGTAVLKPTPAAIDPALVVDATNRERVAAGLVPLSVSTALYRSAEYKVDDMIARQYFEHESPDGKGVADLATRAGYSYVILGENLALGDFDDAADLVAAWMNSPGHRANILNPRYQDIGVSVKRGMYEGKEVWFAVQHFGTGRGACPTIDTALKQSIDAMNSSLKTQEGEITALKEKLQAPGAELQLTYQSEVSLFNKMVDAYNRDLAASRAAVASYNQQVKLFNACIATFQ